MENQVNLIDPIADQKAIVATMRAIKKNTHGGARPGSGRKSKGDEARKFTMGISGTATEIETIRQLAKASGKTTSRFLIELALEEK